MIEDIPATLRSASSASKKVSAAFDGGRITSDGGVMLLAQAERRLGIADQLAAVIPDGRDASRGTHLLPDILRDRICRRISMARRFASSTWATVAASSGVSRRMP